MKPTAAAFWEAARPADLARHVDDANRQIDELLRAAIRETGRRLTELGVEADDILKLDAAARKAARAEIAASRAEEGLEITDAEHRALREGLAYFDGLRDRRPVEERVADMVAGMLEAHSPKAKRRCRRKTPLPLSNSAAAAKRRRRRKTPLSMSNAVPPVQPR